MREHKYRAWDKEEKRFWTQKEMTEIGGYYYNWGLGNYDGRFILMEYTGLKDKKRTKEYPDGQEIYEGDIVYATTRGEQFETEIAIIRWSDYLKCLIAYSKDTDIDDCLPIGRFYEFEVIGNIYENSDLLNKKG